jgi:hypothetical protein
MNAPISVRGWKAREAAAKDRADERKASADIRAKRAANLATSHLTRQAAEASALATKIKSDMEAAKAAPTLQQRLDEALRQEAEAREALQATQAVMHPSATAVAAESKRAK